METADAVRTIISISPFIFVGISFFLHGYVDSDNSDWLILFRDASSYLAVISIVISFFYSLSVLVKKKKQDEF